jgi:methionine synthase II (cobalamin-independent)
VSMPTENVGSLPRSSKLQAAIKAYDAGRITKDELVREQDEACRDSIVRMEATGAPIVSDGEQHQSSFATYPLADTLAGTGMNEKLVPGGQYFAFFADGHNRQLPKLTDGRFRYNTYAASYVEKAVRIAKKPLKQAVIAPSMLALLYPLDGKVEGYSRAQFLEDVLDECERDIRQCFAAGAERVSMDFTEGRLACRKDPRNPWTGRGMLPSFVELNNRVLNRFSAEERRNIGIHTCPGGDCDSTHSADVDYADLLPTMFKMNAGYFLMQMSSERDRERVYKLVGQHMRDDAAGVAQVCFIGVTNPLNPRVETPEEVADALVRAANHIPKERLGSTDDCGFSPFSIDEKPRHGSPDQARDVAFQKIAARVQGTRMASARLGLG